MIVQSILFKMVQELLKLAGSLQCSSFCSNILSNKGRHFLKYFLRQCQTNYHMVNLRIISI